MCGMLPRHTHEISRLEAFSDAVFAFALTLFVVSFLVILASLYLHTCRLRRDLGVKTLEVFDVRSFASQQIVSAAVGVMVVLIAVAAPRRHAFIWLMTFILVWRSHGFYEAPTVGKRKAFEAQLPLGPTPASTSP